MEKVLPSAALPLEDPCGNIYIVDELLTHAGIGWSSPINNTQNAFRK